MLEHGTLTQFEKSDSVYRDLLKLAQAEFNLRSLFNENPNRAARFSLEACGLYLDYSKNLIDEKIFEKLNQLASSVHIEESIEALFRGKHLNVTENKPALHMLLREINVDGIHSEIREAILSERLKMYELAQNFRSGAWLGAKGQRLKTIVNIGIGGSDLGPRMAAYALSPYHQKGLTVHFVSNGDPTELKMLLDTLDPNDVLFIVSSKSFQTEETLMNAQAAYQWLLQSVGPEDIEKHFVAVTAHPDKVSQTNLKFGVILKIWDWVGGRFSVWSSIGLPLLFMIGQAHFEAFLKGAAEMDQHFRYAPLMNNMPVILALLGIWYVNFKNIHQHAVIPYHQLLYHFPNFLQQLEMESNGKSVTLDAKSVEWATCPILWGGIGSNSQHAFHQFLHQGTNQGPIDFIVAAQSSYNTGDQHLYLVAQCISQAEVLMQGFDGPLHQRLQGNRPSNMILFQKLTPATLGALIALYEHKVFLQSRLWQINAFDQPGVERGKTLAKQNFRRLKSTVTENDADPSTARLLNKVKAWILE
ncbi:MAG: glucose-6-phosphate isomerase [Gammaproteobacteria bacterium]